MELTGSFLAASKRPSTLRKPGAAPCVPASVPLESKAVIEGHSAITLRITGQVLGGKNNICITRTGRRFPKASWAKWRDAKVREVREQLPAGWQTIAHPVAVCLDYVAGDRRRRDQPAILDAIFHVLEKAAVVEDDTLLWVSRSTRTYDKAHPQAEITILAIDRTGNVTNAI